jgi:hypothetical protein
MWSYIWLQRLRIIISSLQVEVSEDRDVVGGHW